MNYQFHIEHLYIIRKRLLSYLEDTNLEKQLIIPKGCNNNMLWQIGHCVVSQQRLMYSLSGLPINVSDSYSANFKIGSSPKDWLETPDIEEVKTRLANDHEKIQCIVSNNLIDGSIAFGQTQQPKLWDYADNVDTLAFLSKI